LHHHEARTRKLRGDIEVQTAEARTEVDVVLELEVEPSRLAPAALLDGVLRPAADRDAFVRQVRDQGHELTQPVLYRRVRRLHLPQFLAELAALPHQRRRAPLVLLRLGLPDLPGGRIALRLHPLCCRLDLPALLL